MKIRFLQPLPFYFFMKRLTIIDLFIDYFDLSNSESNRLLKSGGLYINNKRILINRNLIEEDLLFNKYILLRKGKRDYLLLDFSILLSNLAL